MKSFRLSVPGNLLLAGEYAVLEEGGLGIALAAEPRLVLTATRAEDWELVGIWPGGGQRWTPEDDPTGSSAPFFGKVFLSLYEHLTQRGDERNRRWESRVRPARLTIDTSAFFQADGRKKGYGSSAALAAAIAAALADLQGRDDDESVHLAAVKAHRFAQGGSGSGYDVTASFFGGIGVFEGGVEPRWQALDPSIAPSLWVFPGPQAVKTTSSIGKYRLWKSVNSSAAREFLEHSNQLIQTLAKARSHERFVELWADYRDLSCTLGDRIEVDARLPQDLLERYRIADAFVKALGAGNETGAAVVSQPPLPGLGDFLTVSAEGIRRE